MSTIGVKNITMCYGKVCALENISITIEPDKIYGLLGRNGAGNFENFERRQNRPCPSDSGLRGLPRDFAAGGGGAGRSRSGDGNVRFHSPGIGGDAWAANHPS